MNVRPRAVILPVVLVLIGLLSLTMAGFIFFIRAETAGTVAFGDGQQARLAAESGLEEVVATLRQEPHNVRAWFDRPATFRHALVWSEAYDRESDPVRKSGTRKTLFADGASPAAGWRFSVVADRYVEPTGFDNRAMRFGITPESSKLNLNTATDDQIRNLLTPLLFDLQVENPEELISALLDWGDEDEEVRDGGAENEYYNTLTPPYLTKNGDFDSVEELLLVKGFTAAVLYGEDVNRNGVLDQNEDDGDKTFPLYDNGDGILNRGIAPYLTVWSREADTGLDNKPRINLNQAAAAIQAQVATHFTEDELAVVQPAIEFILQLKQQNFDFSQLGSPAELYRGDGSDGGSPTSSPAGAGALATSPITLEQLPYLMDRFSTIDLTQSAQGLAGLINLNSAPARVLALIPGITPEAVNLLVETRNQLDAQALRTTAWPMTSGAVDVAMFHAIAPHVTTKAYQFHVEILGYADHKQAVRRLEWIIEMTGQLAQVRYFRDLTNLGRAWPMDDDEVTGSSVEMGAIGL